jgi:hypothetical protein
MTVFHRNGGEIRHMWSSELIDAPLAADLTSGSRGPVSGPVARNATSHLER